ncbi:MULTISPECIES: MarR family winged helix-turn-helix transcriptional regulator [unclassified Halomonas]|uniref:MarR family winged helix-turn-helix transcriptional regulator n=1 Tax=unclassified Halomonas TaxID=2609666 RepID=UPI0020A1974C|nr:MULTISPECIES: MarR family transcriptional regulator [unclassified Halomonas]MCP1312904.1 MarR family transcriptional regulator [Halomonas sp. 707D7]MCP1327057.1 MarR family transcriptional regulator [Halomonas sp. 707D4]
MDHVDRILAQWQRQRPDLDVAPMGTLGRLKRLNQVLTRAMEKTWAPFGLNESSFDVLATLRREGPPFALSPSALMASTLVTSGTMTHRLQQLEKAGLIERIKNPEDGRGFLISLSEKGFALIDEAVGAHVDMQHALVGGLTDTQRDELDALLKQMLESLDQRIQEHER